MTSYEGFVDGTKVLTRNGYKYIEDISLNDTLLTRGKIKKILNLRRNIYNGYMYNIYIKNHPNVITCTEKQQFFVREKKRIMINNETEIIFTDPKWKNANNLTTNDYYGMVINTRKTIPEFTLSDDITIKLCQKEYWYMMGYFVCDGWLDEIVRRDGKCTHEIRIAVKNNQDEKETLGCINEILPLKKIPTISKRCKVSGCSSFVWHSILKMYGKINEKLIPEWVQDAPIEFIQEFINGYMKADGCIDKCSGVAVVSYNLALGLQRLYLKLGYIFNVSKSRLSAVNGRAVSSYCLIGNENDKSFVEDDYVWYEPFHISKIKAIDTHVYNVEIENGNSYVVENKIINNCQ